ncbi:50S ribosomal protein L22 [Patescibacteria group bacterium]|nr:50S ribosomal protein L22 [Patescibacteria group bacterium]
MNNKAQVYAKNNSARISPKKVAIVLDQVRGKDLIAAKIFLAFDRTKAAKLILKTLKSAEANAINNLKLKKEGLYLSEVCVDGGRTVKSGRAGSKGRHDPLLKRSSKIVVGLSERKQG